MEDDLTWLARNIHKWIGRGQEKVFRTDKAHGGAHWIAYQECLGVPFFTKAQWLARRAELQNKPSLDDHPDAKCIAQNSTKCWVKNVVTDEVVVSHGLWVNADHITHANSQSWRIICTGEVIGDWRDTLERRPADITEPAAAKMMDKAIIEKFMGYVRKMPASLSTVLSSDELHDLHQLCDSELTKRDAAVCGGQKYIDAHWFERGELPPVGVECTAVADGIQDSNCIIVAISTEQVVVKWTENQMFDVLGMPGWAFRPIRTERDKSIEEMKQHCPYHGSWDSVGRIYAEVLYDAGYRKQEGA